MAVPNVLKQCFDRLWDFVKAKEENEFAYEKIQISGQNYKIKIYKIPHYKCENSGAEVVIEVVKR